MRKFNFKKSLLSILLILSIFIGHTALASSLNIDLVTDKNNLEVRINSYPGDNISIVIDRDNTKYYIDQGETDENGSLSFKTKLDFGNYNLSIKSTNDNYKKAITIKGDTDPGPGPVDPEKNTASLYVKGYKGLILNKTNEKIISGESALSFTKRILSNNNITFVESNGYISSIDGQGEFDKGKDSGWMFKINNSFPNVGAGSVAIKAGDSVEWLYTYDMGADIGNPIDGGTTIESEKIKGYLEKAKNKSLTTKDIDEIGKELKESNSLVDIENTLEILKALDVTNQKLLEKSLELNTIIIDRIININNYNNNKSIKLVRENLNTYFSLIENLKDRKEVKDFDYIIEKSLELEEKHGSGILTLEEDDKNEKTIVKEGFNILRDKDIKKIKLNLKDIEFEIKLDLINKNTEEDLVFSYDKDKNSIYIKTRSGKTIDNFYSPIKVSLKNKELVNREFNILLNGESIGGIYNKESKKINFFLNKSGRLELVENIKKFNDTGKVNWAEEAIETMAAKEIAKGIGVNKFNPNASITRAEFASLTGRMLNLNTVSDNPFKDVKDTSWYREDLLKVLEKGYINGRSKDIFDPNGKITREEISKIIGEIVKDYDRAGEKGSLDKFDDENNISAWAREGAEITTGLEIIKGSNKSFNPKSNATRAEAITMLFRLYEILLIK